jgi:phosphoserine phosphatase RsbU/P
VKFPLRSKLILAICLPLVVVYLGMLALEYRVRKRESLVEMENYLTELTAHEALELDLHLAGAAQVARTVADCFPSLRSGDERELTGVLRTNVRNNAAVFGMCLAFEPQTRGKPGRPFAPYVCRSAVEDQFRELDIAKTNPDYTRCDWYQLPNLLGRPAWTDPYFDKGAGEILMCTYSVPLVREGAMQGVVTVDISLEQVRRKVARMLAAGSYGGYCMVVSGTGAFVSHPDKSLDMADSIYGLGEWCGRPELAELGHAMAGGRTGIARIDDYATGRPKWVAYAPVPSVGWSLAAVIPEEIVMADVREHLNRQAVLLLAGLVLLLAVIPAVSAMVVRPIGRLAVVAAEVARGNFDARVTGVRSRDEVGQFAETFNQMVAELKGSVDAQIRETAAREALESELRIARQIQTSLLPTQRPPLPRGARLSLDAHSAPAKIMAGDFYDFWLVEDDVLAVVMADVSGKGVPAAMFMAVAHTVLRNVTSPGVSPAKVLTAANRVLAAENDEGMFVTVFYGHYHVHTGEMVFANGGHNPPLVLRSHGGIETLEGPTGPILGIAPEADYDQRRVTLEPSDVLVLYTDGATEATDTHGAMLGERGLREILAGVLAGTVEEICAEVLRRVDQYRSSPDQDDVTVLALRREGA